jgi:hypothetical protein
LATCQSVPKLFLVHNEISKVIFGHGYFHFTWEMNIDGWEILGATHTIVRFYSTYCIVVVAKYSRRVPGGSGFFECIAEVCDSPRFLKILRTEIENYPILMAMGMY